MMSLSLLLQEQCATDHFQINIAFLFYSIIILCRRFFVIRSAFSLLPLNCNLIKEICLILKPKRVPKQIKFWIPCLQSFMLGVCSRTLYCNRCSAPASILSICILFCQSRSIYESHRFLSGTVCICIYIHTYVDICRYRCMCLNLLKILIVYFIVLREIYTKFQGLFRSYPVPYSYFPNNSSH